MKRFATAAVSAALVFLLASCALAQHDTNVSGGELLPEQAAIDVRHYDLALAVDPAEKTIAGTLRMRARITAATPRLVLDLDDRLKVEAVHVGGAAAAFSHRDGRIAIPLAEPAAVGDQVVVEVDYGGTPREAPNPPWDGGFTWSHTHSGAPWVATTCQGEGADLWWPCKDQPSDKPETMDLFITVPKGLWCASNGTLAGQEEKGDTTTYHWHVANPISNYCVALNIAPYHLLKRSYRSVTGEQVPVWLFALPENVEKAEHALPQFLDHLRQLEEVCGPFPFRNEKYGVAETPHLGMEHQTIIAYGNRYRTGRLGFDWLHHHELSHEWWGNMVTCRDWKDMWIHEGFATYMQALYLERTHGREAYFDEMDRKRALIRNSRPVAPRRTQDSKQIYFGPGGDTHDNDIYYKGSWVLHTLRWLLGDEVFFKALRRMAYPDPALEKVTDGSQERFTDTEEIRAIAERVSGRQLGWFFEVYLRQPELPRLVSEVKDDALVLRWETPKDLPFSLPVPVRTGGSVHRVEMTGGRGHLPLGGKPYAIDPDGWVLMR